MPQYGRLGGCDRGGAAENPARGAFGAACECQAITFRQTIQGETRFIVVYREGGNPARLRFTLAHELGHRLLHRGDEPDMEREADCFASHLLCPRPTLGRLCARENTFSVEQAAVLAYVSASALQRLSRVEELVVSPEILSAADDLLADWAQRVPLPPQRPGQRRLQIRTKFLSKA